MVKLGLTLIVGGGDAEVLERCMKSVQGTLFDDVWITVTADDADIREVAGRYATRVLEFEWCQDFAAARNVGWLGMLDDPTITHKMWLDADDVVKPEEYQKLLALKERLKPDEIVLMDYVYSHDQNDAPVLTLPRERIYPNVEGYWWHDCIHEYINMQYDFNSRVRRGPG